MEKPVSILINDFKLNIEKSINEAGLPPAVIEPILHNYLLQIQSLSNQQLAKDLSEAKEGEK